MFSRTTRRSSRRATVSLSRARRSPTTLFRARRARRRRTSPSDGTHHSQAGPASFSTRAPLACHARTRWRVEYRPCACSAAAGTTLHDAVMADNTGAGRVRQQRVVRECDRILSGLRPPTAAERLARLAKYADDALDPAELPDMYGDGGAVSRLEARTAELLGTEAALLFPTGTMAQQVALRCHAGATGSHVVGMHPLAHPLKWGRDALSVIAGLRPLVLSSGPGQLTAEDVRGSAERFGTLFYELPLREHGFVLPAWDELIEVVQAARDRDAVLHLDGARLWESTTGLGHGLTEIVDLFDSVYVSYY